MTPKVAETSEILTVVFIDIVGYTKTTAQLSREEFTQLHDTFDNITLPLIEKHSGKVIKKIGDAFLITFRSPTNAVLCGTELQNAFEQHNKKSKRPIRIRVAIHTGEVIIRNDDVFGEAVNTTSRIEGITEANQIVFSEAVFSAMNKREVPYIHLGLRKLKGMKFPIRLFRVKSGYDEVLRRRRMIITFFERLILLGLIALAVYFVIKYVLPYFELI